MFWGFGYGFGSFLASSLRHFYFNHIVACFLRVLIYSFNNQCSVVRHIGLDSIDPSLAIGFYCRDKGLLLSQLHIGFVSPYLQTCFS